MEDKGKIIYRARSSAWMPIIVLIIGFGLLFIATIIKNGIEFEKIILVVATIFGIIKIGSGFCNNISVYEKCIVIGKREIRYEDISKIGIEEKDYNTGYTFRFQNSYWNGKFKNERFLQIIYKDGWIEERLISAYTIKQCRKIIDYIGVFAQCDIEEAKESLNKINKKQKKMLL